MKDLDLAIPFPLKGLDVSSSLNAQPPGTTASARNVRGYIPKTGRDQGGQRPGMSKFMTATLNSTYPIQCLDVLVATTPAADGISGGFAMGSGGSGNPAVGFKMAYFGQAAAALTKCGAFTGSSEVFGYAFANTAADSSALYVVLGSNLVCYAERAQISSLVSGATGNLSGNLLFTTALPDSITTACGIDFGDRKVWIATTAKKLYSADPITGALSAALYTSSRSIAALAGNWLQYDQGVVCMGFAAGYVVFYNTVTNTAVEKQTKTVDVVDICKDGAGHFYVLSTDDSAASWLIEYDILGNIVSTTGLPGAGRGVSCCYDPITGNVIVALDASVGAKDVYCYNTAGVVPPAAATLVASGLSSLTAHFTGVRSLNRGDFLGVTVNSTTGTASFCRFQISSVTAYTELDATATITGSGATAVRHWATDSGGAVVTPSPSSFYVRGLGVSGGIITRFSSTGPVSVAITDSNGNMSPGVPSIWSCQLGQKMIFGDGIVYKVYDPTTDTAKELVASSGTIPGDNQNTAARLGCAWRQRLILAGFRFDPFNFYGSAVDDVTNWNLAPSPSVETQAFAGNALTAGTANDVITCLIPYSDEILLLGGSHTIYQVTGDPMAGGRIDLITDSVGIAFGRPWCRDGTGVVYFLSNRGSVYKFAPGGLPEQISESINHLLITTNFDQNLCRMAWDERQYGFHLWITPTTPGLSLHYFFDAHNGAWWQDQYANKNHNPFAVVAFESGDPNQRFILLGGQDGYLRKLDINAADDDGTAINSYVYLGPVRDKGGQGVYLADLQCQLDAGSSGVTWAVTTGPDAQDALLTPSGVQGGTFSAGRNRSQSVRAFGHAAYVLLSGLNVAGSSWALEYMRARLRLPEGKARQRVF